MRLQLFVAAAVLLAGSLCAHADPVLPGTYGGTQINTTGKTIDGTSGTVSYTDSVYQGDPNNPYCATCLEFVIQVDDSGISDAVLDVNTTGFADKYSLSYGYEAVPDGVAPVDVSKSGGEVTFSFGTGFAAGDSDLLIIYTNATADASGGLTVNDVGLDPPAFKPSGDPYTAPAVTPEPSSLILLGTGLIGVAGVIRRRLA